MICHFTAVLIFVLSIRKISAHTLSADHSSSPAWDAI